MKPRCIACNRKPESWALAARWHGVTFTKRGLRTSENAVLARCGECGAMQLLRDGTAHEAPAWLQPLPQQQQARRLEQAVGNLEQAAVGKRRVVGGMRAVDKPPLTTAPDPDMKPWQGPSP